VRHARRVDENHALLRDGLRGLGFDVLDLSGVGGGVPDLCVRVIPGISLFLEVKRPGIKKAEQAMTKEQEVWWSYMHRLTRIVQTVDEAHRELVAFKEKL
jgi:hypothetical protein